MQSWYTSENRPGQWHLAYGMKCQTIGCDAADGDGQIVIVVTLTGYQRDSSSSGGGSLVEREEEGTSMR